jgi:selenide,water dikinase
MVKNLDIFTPIIDEPEIAGEIAACNVTNDVFAMNVPEISGMLVFLAIQPKTPFEIAKGILKGIKNFVEKKIDSKVVGGHTIYSDWPLIGGEASGFVDKGKILLKQGVKLGDKLILTKPIGIQAIMASYRLLKDMPEILEQYSTKEIRNSIDLTVKVITSSNQPVVRTIHSYNDFSFIRAMTDVTGFGLTGHTKELLQNSDLSATIEKVPYIKLSRELSHDLGYSFDDCYCHETAGGMLIAVDGEYMEEFSNRLSDYGIKNWLVGRIDKKLPQNVIISKDVEQIEVSDI